MAIYIRQGTSSLMNHDAPGWTVHGVRPGGIKCRTLAQAKRDAVAAGASGKWRREVHADGVRRKKHARYIDAVDSE